MTTTDGADGVPDQAGRLPRMESVDLLRGLVMVLMALDHTRDYFSNDLAFDPTDLTRTYPALFLTRWITHYCAPVFIFLAGTGAFLSAARGKTKKDLSEFLLSRGLWLVFLELTWVRFGWLFNVDYHFAMGIVIWAIGWSMVALASLVFLPLRWITIFGVLMTTSHNLLDYAEPENPGLFGWLWRILHSGGEMDLGNGYRFAAGYPLIPWIGVMAVGYVFGALLVREPHQRRKWLFLLGGALTLLFVAVRGINDYGDPHPWTSQKNALFTIFSFLNCHKYPPSLAYLLMTLGPALIVLGWLDRGTPRSLGPILIFGRVPLFYYLLHIPLIHGLSVVVAYARHGRAEWLFANPGDQKVAPPPANFGFDLPIVYLVWIAVVLALYPACRWFAEFKRRRREKWLGYL
jgi:uncharacterized membrane protein